MFSAPPHPSLREGSLPYSGTVFACLLALAIGCSPTPGGDYTPAASASNITAFTSDCAQMIDRRLQVNSFLSQHQNENGYTPLEISFAKQALMGLVSARHK
jgi:hypothetical protein